MNKIVMIGPVYPYKTGLSYYVTLLYKTLRKKYDVTLISYTMQYPKLIYRKEQRDYEDTTLKVEEAVFMLNSANPISYIKTASFIKKMKPDLVILQWLHPYFAPCYYSIVKHLHKIPVLYICHNIFPHERFPFDKQLTKIALHPAQYYITHSESDAEDLRSIIRNPKLKVAVHPAYDFFKQKNLSKSQARKFLHLKPESRVLLFFGLVREYKGLKYLLRAMKIINEQMEVNLLIAGDFGGHREEYEEIIERENVGKWISITDKHIPTGEVEPFFAACDLVVLPYVSATQSGVIQVAYSFGKPVLATRVGGLPDVVEDEKTGYLVEPENSKAIAEAIERYFNGNRQQIFSENIKRAVERFSWDRMQKEIEEIVD